MSEGPPDGASRAAWIAVLPPETAAESLAALEHDLGCRGWSAGASAGAEQSILLVEGARDEEALRAALRGAEADVFPLLEPAEYGRLRARRRFLSALVAALGIAIAAGLVYPLLAFLEPPPRALLAPDWVRVEPAERLEVGAAACVRVQGTRLWVLRLAVERWHALSAVCSARDDCLLEWDAERREFRCPCHGCVFDVYGNVVHGPAAIPLVGHATLRRGDELLVRRAL